ncbi:MAG: hypothetical protein HYU29_01560 [Chloroflexi bacterium]|nr:hypothetical protein [Chloroflexota bacterium]
MVSVPGFLLRRLYVKGSLCNTDHGFQFQLRNQLGSGYARRLLPITVDGQPAPLEQAFFTSGAVTTPFPSVSPESPFTLVMNRTVTVAVAGVTLSPGPHKIGMGFEVQGLGTLSFDFIDTVPDG